MTSTRLRRPGAYPTPAAKPAAIYVRLSDDKRTETEDEGLAVKRQREDCERLARTLGLEVSPVDYSDNDKSAFSGKRRPGYLQMLADIEAGKVGAVIAWHTDRLHRSPRELEDYIDICKSVPTHTVRGTMLDLSTATGRTTARLFGVIARQESEHRGERVSRAHQQRAEQGRWRGGTRPFGYDPPPAPRRAGEPVGPMTLNEAEAELIRGAYASVIAGESLASIMRDWNEQGVTTSLGKPWGYATLRQLLNRPRNYGASVYLGEVVATGDWEPIVDQSTFRTAVAVLGRPERRRSTSNVGRHLLAGIILCGECGQVCRSGTVGGRDGARHQVYRCATGKHVNRRASYCDDLIEGLVIGRLSAPDAKELLKAPKIPARGRDALQRKADRLRAKLAEAVSLWQDDIITANDLRAAKADLAERITAAEAALVQPAKVAALGDLVKARDPRQVWDGLSWREKRAVITTLMTVRLLPVPASASRRFDPELVEITWL